MSDIYLEMHETAIKEKLVKQKYISIHNVQSFDINGITKAIIPIKLIYRAERIWVNDGTKIAFYKNRYRLPTDPLSEEELKEFFWITLKSIPL